jgi:hypothetical protein
MSQTTSGPPESAQPERPKTADERLAELDRILDEYELRLGVPALTGEDEVTTEARRVLDLPPSELRKMSAIDCGVAAHVMEQFGRRVQQAVNREQARVTWADRSINRIIAKKVNNYKGYSFEERKLQAINDDDAASKLDEIRVKAQLRIDRISYLAARASGQAKTLLSIKNSKQGDRDRDRD